MPTRPTPSVRHRGPRILTGRNPWQLKAAANHVCFFPPEFKTYAEALWRARLFRRHDRQRLGTGRGQGRRWPAAADGGPAVQIGAPPSHRPRRSATMTTRPTLPTFSMPRPRTGRGASGMAATSRTATTSTAPALPKGGKKLTDIDRVPGCWPDNERGAQRHAGLCLRGRALRPALGPDAGELQSGACWTTRSSSSPRIMACRSRTTRARPTRTQITFPWRSCGGRAFRKPGRVVDDYVSFIDFAPTFIELAGVPWAQTGMATATGRSLTDVLFVGEIRLGRPAARPRPGG